MPKNKKHSRAIMVLSGVGIAILVAAVAFLIMFVVGVFSNSGNSASDEVMVPNFVGKNYTEDIKDNPVYTDFKFVIKDGNDPEKDPGIVLKQSVAEGLTVKKGKEITLIVNISPDSVTLIDVRGQSQLDAYNTIRDQELEPTIVFVADDQTAAGYVVSTDPAGNTSVKKGSKVNIYVSTGPTDTQVKVPAVIGMPLETAKASLEDAGLVVGEVTQADDSGQAAGTVLETDPLPGNKVSSGTTVNIVVSSGEQSSTTVRYYAVLPTGVTHDIDMKVYRNGELVDSKVVNPQINGIVELAFEGKNGVDKVIVTLDGQEYLHVDFDFDNGTYSVTQSYTYQDTASSSSESSSSSQESSSSSSEESEG